MKRILIRSLFAFMIGAALLGGFVVAEAHGKELVLRVRVDFSTFDTAPALDASAVPTGDAAFHTSFSASLGSSGNGTPSES